MKSVFCTQNKLNPLLLEAFELIKNRINALTDVEPLNISIGNSVLSDIINCFDQLGDSVKVKNIYLKEIKSRKNNKYLNLLDKKNISNILFPPLVSLFSIFIVSSAFIYVYEGNDSNDNGELLNTKITD